MRTRVWFKRLALVSALAAGSVVFALVLSRTSVGAAATWQRLASPGRLSSAHAFLESNCAACHTPVAGVEATNCIACHANDARLLQRQPTAFHSDVASCRECHHEHQGNGRPTMAMDHAALAAIGLRLLGDGHTPDAERARRLKQILNWMSQSASDAGARPSGHFRITPLEATLNCVACHGTKDHHFGLFGQDCAQCHATVQWKIPEFRHPSPNSQDCAQCHQAPPSHYMEHFKMISSKVACQPNARVDQCYLCHQTTAWNDIKGVGWYKHH